MSTIPHLGMLGLGSLTTAWYLQNLNEEYQRGKGGYATCPLIMLNTDFDRINPWLPDRFEKLEPVLAEYLDSVHALGVTSLVVPNITIHQALDKMGIPEGLDLLHPLKLGSAALNDSRPVMVLGTRHTMSSSYFQDYWKSLQVRFPSEQDIELVDQLRIAVYEGQASNTQLEHFGHQLIRWSADYQVVLACTELSLAFESLADADVIDLARLQVEAAVRRVLRP